MKPITRKVSWGLVLAVSAIVPLAAWQKWIPIANEDAWAFTTGAICVFFCVEESVWNFPIGIANNVVFFKIFYDGKLYANMGLQVVYVLLGLQGWYQWLYSGENKSRLTVTRTPPKTAVLLAALSIPATYGMRRLLLWQDGNSQFLDALTTVLSLVAQFLMNGKRLENWCVWLVADFIYIFIFFQQELYLSAALYILFVIMCVVGLNEWTVAMRSASLPKAAVPVASTAESEAA